MRPLRAFTALGIIALCAVATYRGWHTVQFAAAEASTLARAKQRGDMASWLAFPGIGDLAATATLPTARDAANRDGAARRAEGLATLLSRRPTLAGAWLSLAAMCLYLGKGDGDTLAALSMSWLTGPNEEAVMWPRGIFALSLWTALPGDDRQRTILDLSGAFLGTLVGEDQLTAARAALAGQSAEIRREVAARIEAAGVPADTVARLGF